MKRVDVNKFYSLREAINYVPLKTKDTLSRYVNKYQGAKWSVGKVWIKKRAEGKGKTSKRYIISGEWIKEFNKRYKAGKLNKYNIFSPDETRYTVTDLRNISKATGVISVEELLGTIQNEEKKRILPRSNR